MQLQQKILVLLIFLALFSLSFGQDLVQEQQFKEQSEISMKCIAQKQELQLEFYNCMQVIDLDEQNINKLQIKIKDLFNYNQVINFSDAFAQIQQYFLQLKIYKSQKQEFLAQIKEIDLQIINSDSYNENKSLIISKFLAQFKNLRKLNLKWQNINQFSEVVDVMLVLSQLENLKELNLDLYVQQLNVDYNNYMNLDENLNQNKYDNFDYNGTEKLISLKKNRKQQIQEGTNFKEQNLSQIEIFKINIVSHSTNLPDQILQLSYLVQEIKFCFPILEDLEVLEIIVQNQGYKEKNFNGQLFHQQSIFGQDFQNLRILKVEIKEINKINLELKKDVFKTISLRHDIFEQMTNLEELTFLLGETNNGILVEMKEPYSLQGLKQLRKIEFEIFNIFDNQEKMNHYFIQLQKLKEIKIVQYQKYNTFLDIIEQEVNNTQIVNNLKRLTLHFKETFEINLTNLQRFSNLEELELEFFDSKFKYSSLDFLFTNLEKLQSLKITQIQQYQEHFSIFDNEKLLLRQNGQQFKNLKNLEIGLLNHTKRKMEHFISQLDLSAFQNLKQLKINKFVQQNYQYFDIGAIKSFENILSLDNLSINFDYYQDEFQDFEVIIPFDYFNKISHQPKQIKISLNDEMKVYQFKQYQLKYQKYLNFLVHINYQSYFFCQLNDQNSSDYCGQLVHNFQKNYCHIQQTQKMQMCDLFTKQNQDKNYQDFVKNQQNKDIESNQVGIQNKQQYQKEQNLQGKQQQQKKHQQNQLQFDASNFRLNFVQIIIILIFLIFILVILFMMYFQKQNIYQKEINNQKQVQSLVIVNKQGKLVSSNSSSETTGNETSSIEQLSSFYNLNIESCQYQGYQQQLIKKKQKKQTSQKLAQKLKKISNKKFREDVQKFSNAEKILYQYKQQSQLNAINQDEIEDTESDSQYQQQKKFTQQSQNKKTNNQYQKTRRKCLLCENIITKEQKVNNFYGTVCCSQKYLHEKCVLKQLQMENYNQLQDFIQQQQQAEQKQNLVCFMCGDNFILKQMINQGNQIKQSKQQQKQFLQILQKQKQCIQFNNGQVCDNKQKEIYI
ncbi:hypothetical protein PPERSA_00053 [Pseudocohnilembus persalinus]|uniref:Transmembrane protein n=1 Tax=Pseudocohnilembus persalinus TaxID=266149 RepID=A0A0V0Q8R3_PSEPJ|nr:hypothetical protein PPERSA_00053 [Pseudocohnilembus persalinus]|eukprot:KRW98561.1 hypothetical protein PPERSA_00053 [Pseudocohnilembus persalinus]